jgi:hypothetical protein
MTTMRAIVLEQVGAPIASPFCWSGVESAFTTLHGNVTINGVGFWDIIHGQTGVAPNGIELHPVLSFTGTCTRR